MGRRPSSFIFVALGACIELKITSPRNGSVLDLTKGRDNGGIDLKILVAIDSGSEYHEKVKGGTIGLFINGTGISFGGLDSVASGSPPGFLMPLTKWQAGRAWLHFELCKNTSSIPVSSVPVMVQVKEWYEYPSGARAVHSLEITLVLTLTIDDAHRALVLLGTIIAHECHEYSIIKEMIVVVPDSHAFALRLLAMLEICFEIIVINESTLFDGMIQESWNRYALQMAIKLLVARYVRTSYYITLDADVLVVGGLDVGLLLPGGKAMFIPEPRSVHPHWWLGSIMTLGLKNDSFADSMFGVTPAVLSTFGAQVTTASVSNQFRDTDWQRAWLASWKTGMWWSEYSLYRLALDARGMFTNLHALSTSSVICNAIWFQHQLPWDSNAAFHNLHCCFSLVQSTTDICPSAIAAGVSKQLEREKERERKKEKENQN